MESSGIFFYTGNDIQASKEFMQSENSISSTLLAIMATGYRAPKRTFSISLNPKPNFHSINHNTVHTPEAFLTYMHNAKYDKFFSYKPNRVMIVIDFDIS